MFHVQKLWFDPECDKVDKLNIDELFGTRVTSAPSATFNVQPTALTLRHPVFLHTINNIESEAYIIVCKCVEFLPALFDLRSAVLITKHSLIARSALPF